MDLNNLDHPLLTNQPIFSSEQLTQDVEHHFAAQDPVEEKIPVNGVQEDVTYKVVSKTLLTSAFPLLIMSFFNGNIVYHYLKSQGEVKILGAYGLGNNLINIIAVAVFMSMNEGF